MKTKMTTLFIVVSIIAVAFSACGKTGTPEPDAVSTEAVSSKGSTQEETIGITEVPENESESNVTEDQIQTEDLETEAEDTEKMLQMKINGTVVNVLWEENESVDALMDMCKDAPLEIQMSMYGGFEQVGPLGRNLPRNDSQTTTSSGDIVLYSGNQIVVFYGSNSWSYTRLGKITDKSEAELKTLLDNASKGRYGRDKAVEIREAARRSIGSKMPAKSLELRHTIQLILELDKEIDEVEAAIAEIMYSIQSPITTIPGMGLRMGAMILAEVGDFANFDSPDKILAYAGLSPSTYESGKLSLTGAYSHMEKRGSRYLRYAIFNATKYVCIWDPTFAAYLAKKRAEGKHYNVAISHAAKKLVRVIYALQKSGKAYRTAT